MRLHFSSTKTGLFDQVFSFEIQGTRRQYQVCCRGICTYPTISEDPRSAQERQCRAPVQSQHFLRRVAYMHLGLLDLRRYPTKISYQYLGGIFQYRKGIWRFFF